MSSPRNVARGVYCLHLHNFVHKNVLVEAVLVLGREEGDDVGCSVYCALTRDIRNSSSITNTN